jgi:hypothetical protein
MCHHGGTCDFAVFLPSFDFFAQSSFLILLCMISLIELLLYQQHAGSDGVFIDVDQIFDDPIVPDMALLKSIMMNLETLGLICDIKSQGDNKYYRLNDNKLIKWLQCKARA